MIQKLLKLEMLQYISDNEVKLTEKGLQHLSSNQKQ
jgi:Mn-dependent DtxR family transcriptional regulator